MAAQIDHPQLFEASLQTGCGVLVSEQPPTLHSHVVSKTVLVVEDEEEIRVLVHEILADAGYRVLEAADGAAAVQLLRGAERIDLLITDLGLPGALNGREVADAGRAARPGLRVLFVTGYAADGVRHPDTGTSVLAKPFHVVELEWRVRDLIGAG